MGLVVELTVEPFAEGAPGTTVTGDDAAVLSGVDAIVRAAVDAGATSVSLQISQA